MFETLKNTISPVNDSNSININSNDNDNEIFDLYQTYARPLNAKIMKAVNIAKNYTQAQGDWLSYVDSSTNQTHTVLDAVGGYGANLLGHNNQEIQSHFIEQIKNLSSNLTQGSIRKNTAILAQKISQILSQESGQGPWVTTFSNSGTEAVEAALKHCYLNYFNKSQQLAQNLRYQLNEMLNLDIPIEFKDTIKESIENLLLKLETKPLLIAIEGGYHGKSLGSLKVTHSESYRDPFYLGSNHNNDVKFIPRDATSSEIELFLSNFMEKLSYVTFENNQLTHKKIQHLPIAGIILEPIQGEAGIYELSYEMLNTIREYTTKKSIPLVFDEIQCGSYRCGAMSAATNMKIVPDIYIFSKALGGGLVKIGATAIKSDHYQDKFGFLHTSTFAEDDLSASVSLKVLNLLSNNNFLISQGMSIADELKHRLEQLRIEFPTIIKEIRGRGLMLVIEFRERLGELGYEFRSMIDSNMYGYILASSLLNKEQIRMLPSLSNPNTLRVQPSLYFNLEQLSMLIRGLTNLCLALQNKNVYYFVSSIYPQQEIPVSEAINSNFSIPNNGKPLAVFLSHPIDENHIRSFTPSLSKISNQLITEKISAAKDFLDFSIFYTQTLKDINDQEINIALLSVSITSNELKEFYASNIRHRLVAKIQKAIDYAYELGATTVGLGQFTSIVSGNGLYLDHHGMNITTGNAYTIQLTIESAYKIMNDRGITIDNSTIALIGAAGNIISTAASIVAEKAAKIQLIYHTEIHSSDKFKAALRSILKEICKSKANGKIIQILKPLLESTQWSNYSTHEETLLKLIQTSEFKNCIELSSHMDVISRADLVLSGANSSKSIFNFRLLKDNAVIVDIAVPASLSPNDLKAMKLDRPDIKYLLGGVAKIPHDQSINTKCFPLRSGQVFACMAETFSIAFSGEKNIVHTGIITKDMIEKAKHYVANAGFKLDVIKTKASL
jgi:acetylornithine/succinyldiaminopimelate/putrescine aminotransferase/predicted amino acid dehydrogenase